MTSTHPRAESISPPPSKRRRTSAGQQSVGRDTSGSHTGKGEASPLRIFSWNVNGISTFLQPSVSRFFKPAGQSPSNDTLATSGASLRQVLRKHNWPQLFFLQEVKMNPDDDATKRYVEAAVNKLVDKQDDGPTYTVRFCLPRDKYNARGFGRKVYGVASIIRDDFLRKNVASVREVDFDVEGRVLVVETREKLAIFNIYAVNGTDNAYKDPGTGQIAGTRHDRKLAFHRLLVEECKGLEQDGFRIVIAGDLNVAPARIDGHPKLRTKPYQHVKNREDFHDRFLRPPSSDKAGLAMADSFRHLHPTEKKYSWVSRTRDWLSSCDRVDLILVSRSLVDAGALLEADVHMTIADRGPSDHVPIHIALDMDKITND